MTFGTPFCSTFLDLQKHEAFLYFMVATSRFKSEQFISTALKLIWPDVFLDGNNVCRLRY